MARTNFDIIRGLMIADNTLTLGFVKQKQKRKEI